MENKQTQTTKDTLQNMFNKEQLKIFQESIKKYWEIIKKILQNKQSDRKLFMIISLVTLGFFGYSAVNLYTQIQTLNKQSSNLNKINNYDIQLLKINKSTQSIVSSSTTIEDLIKGNEDIKQETQRYKKHKENLQLSYTNFLQYIFLPSLNIWKEPYKDQLKTDLLGKNFLNENPYNDLNLFEKWADFLSTSNNNQINEIKNLDLGDITDNGSGLFYIPISFSFTAPSKSALLILTDKLTQTSDKENISLIGEFSYYLRQQIKNDKKTTIETIQKEAGLSGDNDTIVDKTIGYSLYNWIFNNKPSALIDDTIINKTITTMMECKPDTEAQCYYRFRDKFRNISQLAYTIGIDNSNKADALKEFFKNIPPLIAIQTFTYNKVEENSILQQQNTKYQGEVKLRIYGQNITENDMDEIAEKLGEECLGENKKISVEEASKIIEDALQKRNTITDNNDENNTSNIGDLKNIINQITTEYPMFNNYKKTIRLFEIYRMLNENGLCKTL